MPTSLQQSRPGLSRVFIALCCVGALSGLGCGAGVGEEGGACNNNGICLPDLECHEGLCQRNGGARAGINSQTQNTAADDLSTNRFGPDNGVETGGDAAPSDGAGGAPSNSSDEPSLPVCGPVEEPPEREIFGDWEVRDNVVVYDHQTGHIWTRDDQGGPFDQEQAIARCAELASERRYGVSGWRLPKVQELRSLVDGCASGGASCRVSDPSCLDPELCWSDDCDRCSTVGGPRRGPGDNGCYRSADVWEGDCATYISASKRPQLEDPACNNSSGGCTPPWMVSFRYGWVFLGGPFTETTGLVLCVSD